MKMVRTHSRFGIPWQQQLQLRFLACAKHNRASELGLTQEIALVQVPVVEKEMEQQLVVDALDREMEEKMG